MSQITYKGLKPATKHSSAAAKGASRKSDTKPECRLRKALWRAGTRYRKNVADLLGKPDVVYKNARIAIFCDGDFWHGKAWKLRKRKLEKGSNPDYWIKKIEQNMARDKANTLRLQDEGWTVLHFWESEIYDDLEQIVCTILKALTRNDDKRRDERK